MLKQFLRKRAKILKGLLRTRILGHKKAYSAHTFWDENFYTKGLSDRQTISPDKNVLAAAYHYASVESLILRHLRKSAFDLHPASVCDLGSGSGHWIDFYLSLGASRCIGIDISHSSIAFLSQKYAGRDDVTIEHGRIHEVLQNWDDQSDLVNAIGIMFHLVDDEEWQQTIEQVARILRPGGLFVVGGHFGWFDNVNVEFGPQNTVYKRLRSASHWKRILKGVGLGQTEIYRNRAYLFIRDTLPENNILIARKQS